MRKRGDQLKVGDVVKDVWFMPEGSRVLKVEPYTGKFQDDFSALVTFQSRTPRGETAMAVGSETFEIIGDDFPLTREQVKDVVENPENMDGEIYETLYRYYCGNGEMPYGTAKARDGDPDQWIFDRLVQRLAN